VDHLEYPPVKGQNQTVGGKPVYALLHPETPASQVEPEKKLPKPRPLRAAKTEKTHGAAEKASKSAKASPSKKDKAATKSRAKNAKKKKHTSAAGGHKTSG